MTPPSAVAIAIKNFRVTSTGAEYPAGVPCGSSGRNTPEMGGNGLGSNRGPGGLAAFFEGKAHGSNPHGFSPHPDLRLVPDQSPFRADPFSSHGSFKSRRGMPLVAP